MNLSIYADALTARTRPECAAQRAEHIASLGAKNVLELCVGPSLKTLEEAYQHHNIQVTGNDIQLRWKHYYPEGHWLIGDASRVSYEDYDTVVFAPPLSKNCSGKREDSLMIDDVVPTYKKFLARKFRGIMVLVLPARSLGSRWDRTQFHRLLASIGREHQYYEIKNNEGVRNYVDVYVT